MKTIDPNTIPRDESISQKLKDLDFDTVRNLIDYTDRRIDGLVQTCSQLQARSTTFLGWAIAAFSSLSAVLVSLSVNTSPNIILVVMTLYGLVSLSVVIGILLYGTLTKTSILNAGEGPSNILRDDVLKQLAHEKKDKLLYIFGWHLMEEQWKLDANWEINKRLVKNYRTAIITFVSAAAGAIVLLGILVLVI